MHAAKRQSARPIRGVNLGNWLVLERWMESSKKPGPFAGTEAEDEFGLRSELDSDELASRLDTHRSTYVTRDNLAWLAERGCNLVRVPLPYHVFGDDRHGSCIEHVDQVMGWSEELGLPVLLDLHTVPGGQNGFDNSGICGLCTWHQEYEQIYRTLDVLERLAHRYAGHPALFGIEPMNEPASPKVFKNSMKRYGANHPQRVAQSMPVPLPVLKQFYRLVYERIRPIVGPEVALVFHDQFQLGAWHSFMPRNRYANVWIDTHQYIATYVHGLHVTSLRGHLLAARIIGAMVARSQRYHPTLVGEWSLSHHIRKVAKVDEDEKRRIYMSYASAQLAAFDRGEGCCFWSLRNARYRDWNLEKSLKGGWLDLEW